MYALHGKRRKSPMKFSRKMATTSSAVCMASLCALLLLGCHTDRATAADDDANSNGSSIASSILNTTNSAVDAVATNAANAATTVKTAASEAATDLFGTLQAAVADTLDNFGGITGGITTTMTPHQLNATSAMVANTTTTSSSSASVVGVTTMPELTSTVEHDKSVVGVAVETSTATAAPTIMPAMQGSDTTMPAQHEAVSTIATNGETTNTVTASAALPITTIEPITSTEPTTTPMSYSERQGKEHNTEGQTMHINTNGTEDSSTPIVPHVLAEQAQQIVHEDEAHHMHHPPHMHLTNAEAEHIQHIHGNHGHDEHDHEHVHDPRVHTHSDEEQSTEHVISSTSNDIFAEGKEHFADKKAKPIEGVTVTEGISRVSSTTAHNATHDTEGKIIQTPAEVLINQISHEFEEDDKDLNNFRHPATLITASNSDESMMAAMMMGMKDNDTDSTASGIVAHHEEDPYHAHVISEQHDRLPDQDDFKLIAADVNGGAVTTTTTTSTTTTSAPLISKDEIIVSEENRATVVPVLAVAVNVSNSGGGGAELNETRARAMNMDEDDERHHNGETATTTEKPVVVSIVEGQHQQHEHDHVISVTAVDVTGNQSDATSRNSSDEATHYIFAGEGRSVGDSSSAISAENDDGPLNYHYHNFVTTERGSSNKSDVQKNGALVDLSDISMDDEDHMDITHSHTPPHTDMQHATNDSAVQQQLKINDMSVATAAAAAAAAAAMQHECSGADGKMYKNGEAMNRGCEERCTCNRGDWICEPRCMGNTFRIPPGGIEHMDNENPLCRPVPVDECCAMMECGESALAPTMHSELGRDNEASDAAGIFNASQKPRPDCHYMGSMYKFRERLEIGCEQICHCDEGGVMNCKPRCPERNHTRLDKCVYVKDPKDVCCQLELCDVTLDDHEQTPSPPTAQNAIGDEHYNGLEEARDVGSAVGANGAAHCEFKGQHYHDGQQFHDGCEQLCICTPEGVHCSKLQCPSTFGLELLNPHCLRWEPEPATFKPIPPVCCPEKMRCVDNGTCTYNGQTFDNWSPIPTNLTGCEQHCYCENGKVECRPACPPVLALPPPDLPCHPAQARVMPIPDDECCRHWACPPAVPKLGGSGAEEEIASTAVPPHNTFTEGMHNAAHNDHNNNSDGAKNDIPHNKSTAKQPIDAFYPTVDGKPPKSMSPAFGGEFKPEKHDKHEKFVKKPVAVKPQQNEVKYDVHEPQDEHEPVPPGFIPIHLGVTNSAGHPPLGGLHYHPQQGPAHNGANYGFYNPAHPSKDHYDPYNSYEPYDLNPNGIAQGKPPAPTSQSDLFNILGAGPPGPHGGIRVNPGGLPPPSAAGGKGNSNVLPQSPHLRIEHILQHLQNRPPGPGAYIAHHGHSNGSGGAQAVQPHPHPHGHVHPQLLQPQYVPIVHSGLPPPPPPHGIAIVDGQPVAYGGYPIVPGLGQPPHLHDQHQPQRPQHISQQQQQKPPHDTIAATSTTSTSTASASSAPASTSTFTSTSTSTTSAIGLTAQSTQHGVLPATATRPAQTGFNNLQSDIEVLNLEAIDPRTIRIVFTVPPTYVNLHGRVELRYTNGPGNDTTTWEQQIFAPPEDLIATSQMEFDLPGLEPNSLYKVKITLILRDLNAQPTSDVLTVKTPADRSITPPPISDYRPDFKDVLKNIEDPELNVSETNSTWLQLTWKKIPDEQLEYVDGVQLRYKELTGLIYSSTPLIHRTLTSYTIENLQPETGYEIGLFFIPFPGHGGDMLAGHMIKVRTAPKVDVYNFDVMVNVTKVKSQSVEVSWSGVPYPEDKYVNIYRAIYQSDGGKEDSSVFKVAKRDSTTGTLIMDLKPGTRYRLWLEMYLTNGNIKKSNVVNFTTKLGGPAVPGKTGKLLTASSVGEPVGDYYGPLVIVSVVAALAIMSTIALLLILTRRRVHQTASITPPRKNDAAYDNPSYKVEIQQETMNL